MTTSYMKPLSYSIISEYEGVKIVITTEGGHKVMLDTVGDVVVFEFISCDGQQIECFAHQKSANDIETEITTGGEIIESIYWELK